MSGLLPTYLVAFSAMLLAAVSAVTLITVVRHFDPPETPPAPAELPVYEKIAV